jgi:hypothetical protein
MTSFIYQSVTRGWSAISCTDLCIGHSLFDIPKHIIGFFLEMRGKLRVFSMNLHYEMFQVILCLRRNYRGGDLATWL